MSPLLYIGVTWDTFRMSGTIPVVIDSLYICVKGFDSGSQAIFINLLGISNEALFSSRFENSWQTSDSVVHDIIRLALEDLMYFVGLSLFSSIYLANVEPTVRKCWLNCSAISILFV